MKIIDLIRLLRKNIVLLVLAPLFLAGIVTYLTRKPDFKFASETSLYTGIASGSTVEMDKSLSFFATNTAFDNLINVIKSRETQQEVAIRLLSQHLLLDKPDPKYISSNSYSALKRITPGYIQKLIVRSSNLSGMKSNVQGETETAPDNLPKKDTFSFNNLKSLKSSSSFPASIDLAAYEQTVKNLTEYMLSSDTNFVYKLLNFSHPHYSIKAISTINAQRIASSDLVRLKYETDDPGICQQTLILFTEVCITNYKNIKENRSDAIVKYFQFQLSQAAARLKVAEDKLLQFNMNNNIINYYEQSKAVAVVKEDLDVDLNNKKIKLAGVQAAIVRLEEKLGIQQQIQLKSEDIIDKRNQLGVLNYKIASAEAIGSEGSKDIKDMANLKVQSTKLKQEIQVTVSELYSFGNSTDGLPIKTILSDWITNVIEAENIKAGIDVLTERIKEFQKQYAIYAPAGANIKRIEREISVSEQEFLEILHGLNLAKLKMQDNELSSNIKAVDLPYYPVSPIPSSRKILIIVAALLGFIIVLISILVTEYFDDTLKNPVKASKILKLSFLGVFPKILLQVGKFNMPFITNRLLEISIQNIELLLKRSETDKSVKTLLFFSTLSKEGKSVIVGNLALKLKKQGKKVLVLNFSRESLRKTEVVQIGYPEIPARSSTSGNVRQRKRISLIGLLLGYPDSRIDFESPFLENPENYLSKAEYLHYTVDDMFYPVKNYEEILHLNGFKLSYIPDFVLIELPPVLYYPYPVSLVSEADIPIMVCRSNRVWSDADQGALHTFMELARQKTHFILNGVELRVIESILGDLPKKRSQIRRTMKDIFRFQFFTRDQL